MSFPGRCRADSASHAKWWRPAPASRPHRNAVGMAAPREARAPAASALPFWGLMAFTFILVVAPQGWFPALSHLRIALVLGVLALGSCLLDRFIHGESLSVPAKEIVLAACLAGWAVATVPLSFWPGGSLSFLLGFYFKTLAIFWLLCNTVGTLARLRQVATGLSLMSIPLAATAARNFHSGGVIPPDLTGEATRILGYDAPLTANPN